MAVIVDTGVLLAAADTDDEDRDRCSELLRTHRAELWVPAPVIPETATGVRLPVLVPSPSWA